MSKLLQMCAAVAVCVMMGLGSAQAQEDYRVNRSLKLYVPPWSEEYLRLSENSCPDLEGAECAALQRLMNEPHAYWVGHDVSLRQELRQLHGQLEDAKTKNQLLTLVLHRFPHRNCGGSGGTLKKVTIPNYKRWIVRLAATVRYHKAPVNIVIEPGWFADVMPGSSELCDGLPKSDVLEQRIELIRFIIYNFDHRDEQNVTVDPNLRLCVDAGNPSQVSEPKHRLALANALERIYKLAPFHCVSVNVGSHHSFDDSISYAKRIIKLMELDDLHREPVKLTIAFDKSLAGNPNVQGSCNARGTALDKQPATLNHADPQVEVVMNIHVPGKSQGDGLECNGGGPVGDFDHWTLVHYLHNTAVKYPLTDD